MRVCPRFQADSHLSRIRGLLYIFRKVRQFHVALASQRVVHSESSRQVMTGLTHLGNLQVIPQQLLIVRMCTVLDDGLCTLDGTLTTQVGNTLFGHDDVLIMLRAVLMADERND